MNKQQSASSTKKTKTATSAAGPKRMSYLKPRMMIESALPNDPSCASSFVIISQTPSLCWRPKPSIKSCFHQTFDVLSSTKLFDTTAMDAISSHRYDLLKASLHSTILPATVSKGNEAIKTKQKIMPSKSFPHKLSRGTSSLICHPNRGSVQSIPIPVKRRCWVPTPAEMVKIGDKIPKAFVKTSLTGRKTVEVPTDTRTWLRGNLTPIESSTSVTQNQVKLVRGAKLLNTKSKKKDKEQKCPPPVNVPANPSKTAPEPEVQKPGKPSKNDLPIKPSPCSKMRKKEFGGRNRMHGEPSRNTRRTRKGRCQRPFQLNTVYVNTTSRLELYNGESSSAQSLPPQYTPSENTEAKCVKKIAGQSASLGFGAFIECFYCRVRFPIGELNEHQSKCGKKRSINRSRQGLPALDMLDDHFENSSHKLEFDRSSCSLMTQTSRPLVIEEGGRLSALPSMVSSNDALNRTCWYCGWKYSPEIAERHFTECAAIRGIIRPTAEGKKLRRLVERKMKTFGRLNPRKKNLWC